MRTLLLALLIACASAAIAEAQRNIRDVDFANYTYEPFCAGGPDDKLEKVTVKNREFASEKQEEGYVDRFHFRVFEIAFGDITGDRRDEAVVLTVCNTGGTGNFSEGFVYTMRAGKPTLVSRIPGGDRAYGGLRTAKIENGLIVIESNDVGELGGACCPEMIVTTKYKLTRNRLVRSGPEVRRPIYPQERVTFAKGTSGKTFKTTLAAGEGRRFTVSARANQSLTVSVDTEDVQLRLLEEAPVTEGINNFLAKLPKTGDYTIELRNGLDREIQVTLNIRID
jgi:hypothetical protein